MHKGQCNWRAGISGGIRASPWRVFLSDKLLINNILQANIAYQTDPGNW